VCPRAAQIAGGPGVDEVVRFLEAVPTLKARAALTTVYAAGLRASEAPSIKVADTDSSRMVVSVEQSKGRRDRYIMLSPQLLSIPRSYWRLAHPTHWLLVWFYLWAHNDTEDPSRLSVNNRQFAGRLTLKSRYRFCLV
jgi:integrase